MRFSSYNILTRKLANGDHVLLNSLSGMLDLIDEEAYQVVTAHSDDDELAPDVMVLIESVREHFLEGGFLTELDRKAELVKAEEYALRLAENIEKVGSEKWAVVLIPNLGCNYRCTYCFEKDSGYPAVMMSKEQVDAIFGLIKDKVVPEKSITLYGGEPLAKENRELIEYIVKKGAEIKQDFFAVTNGHDLEHYMDLLGAGRISLLQISVDGPKEIHDRRRISREGGSSYDKLMSNIETALNNTDVSITLRINLDKRNAPFVMELMDDLDRRGFLDNPLFNAACNLVTGVGELTANHKDIKKLESAVEAKYPDYKEMFMGYTVVSGEAILPALYFGHPIQQRAAVCGAPDGMKIFSPDGKIYSCWSFIGHPDQVIGTYDNSGNIRWNNPVLDNWKKTLLAHNKKCLSCRYALICAGGCHRYVITGENSDNSYDCEYYNNLFDEYLAKVTEEYLADTEEAYMVAKNIKGSLQ